MPQRCSVCAHPRADLVNERLRVPEPPPLPSVAREFDVTRFALMRHRDHHLNLPPNDAIEPEPTPGVNILDAGQ
jgi:hypothetical protein